MARIGYARVSTRDQHPQAQRERLLAAGCERVFTDVASGKLASRPEWDKCLEFLRDGDVLVATKLDRIGRSVRNLIEVSFALRDKGVGLVCLDQEIDTTTAMGRMFFTILAAFAEFERELIVERTKAGMAAARARGRSGGRPFKMTPAKLRLAMAAMGQPETKIGALCAELGVTRQTLYRHVDPKGELRPDGQRVLAGRRLS
jgi:DNA invertase Pin-like site-specific DNA recombinase